MNTKGKLPLGNGRQAAKHSKSAKHLARCEEQGRQCMWPQSGASVSHLKLGNILAKHVLFSLRQIHDFLWPRRGKQVVPFQSHQAKTIILVAQVLQCISSAVAQFIGP